MDEIGIDISNNKTQAVFDVFKSGQFFPYVITVCNESEAAGCRSFRVLRTGCIGVSLILLRLPGHTNNAWRGRAKFVTIFKRKSKPGVMKCVLSMLEVVRNHLNLSKGG